MMILTTSPAGTYLRASPLALEGNRLGRRRLISELPRCSADAYPPADRAAAFAALLGMATRRVNRSDFLASGRHSIKARNSPISLKCERPKTRRNRYGIVGRSTLTNTYFSLF